MDDQKNSQIENTPTSDKSSESQGSVLSEISANVNVHAQPRRQIKQWLPFFVIFFSLTAIVHALLLGSLLSENLFSPTAKMAITIVICILFFTIPINFVSNMTTAFRWPKFLSYISYSWLGFFGIWLSFSAISFFVVTTLAFLSDTSNSNPFNSIFSFTFLLSGGLSVIALYQGQKKPKLNRVKVKIQNWPAEWEGLKIIQLSDLHIGLLNLDKNFLSEVVERVNTEKPDIVVITGDLVEGPLLKVAPQLEPLKKMQARYGRFFVTGNHEYYHGGHVWEKIVQGLGWSVLANQSETIHAGRSIPLQIVGVTDYMAGRIDPASASQPEKAFSAVNESFPVIFLAHEPRSYFQVQNKRIDLQLSGHTHGGQIFPMNFMVYLQQPTNRGLKKVNKSWIYTHMGTGYWGPPMRLGTFSEIAILSIHSS